MDGSRAVTCQEKVQSSNRAEISLPSYYLSLSPPSALLLHPSFSLFWQLTFQLFHALSSFSLSVGWISPSSWDDGMSTGLTFTSAGTRTCPGQPVRAADAILLAVWYQTSLPIQGKYQIRVWGSPEQQGKKTGRYNFQFSGREAQSTRSEPNQADIPTHNPDSWELLDFEGWG